MVAMLVVAIALVGCAAPQVRPVTVTLPLPPRPALTPVPASAVQCLAPGTYAVLVNRERALRTWGLQLEAIINANNSKATKEK